MWLQVSDADNAVAGWSQMHFRDTGPLTKIVGVLAKAMEVHVGQDVRSWLLP